MTEPQEGTEGWRPGRPRAAQAGCSDGRNSGWRGGTDRTPCCPQPPITTHVTSPRGHISRSSHTFSPASQPPGLQSHRLESISAWPQRGLHTPGADPAPPLLSAPSLAPSQPPEIIPLHSLLHPACSYRPHRIQKAPPGPAPTPQHIHNGSLTEGPDKEHATAKN